MNAQQQYGVRGPDPRNTVVKAGTREEAEDMLLPGDVLMVRERDCAMPDCDCWDAWREVAS